MAYKVLIATCLFSFVLSEKLHHFHPSPYQPFPPPPPAYPSAPANGYLVPQPPPPPPIVYPDYADAPPKYSFSYGVSDEETGTNFAHSESRDGYKTEGTYSVDLPDGRKQVVTYVDNGGGLLAEVTYE